jgi:hypothetical protein
MSEKKTLLDMTENELLEGCRRTAESTEFWHDHYYREIERRTQNKHTRAMIWLTAAIGALTFVATIATIISAIK